MQKKFTHLVYALEKAECEIERSVSEGKKSNHESWIVTLPGLDGYLLSAIPEGQITDALCKLFADRLELKLSEDGKLEMNMIYWNPVQIALHFLVSALPLYGYLTGSSGWTDALLVIATGNLVLFALSFLSVFLWRRSVFDPIAEKAGIQI